MKAEDADPVELAGKIREFLSLADDVCRLEADSVLGDYYEFTNFASIYPECGTSSPLELSYLALGLGGESGEFQEIIKKFLRGDFPQGLPKDRVEKELGDVLFYWIRSCYAVGTTPERVIAENIRKLCRRKVEKKLHGSGDDR